MTTNPSPDDEIARLRGQLVPRLSKGLDLIEPSFDLDLESRRESPTRMFKHLHQTCQAHFEQFRTASEVKLVSLLDAYTALRDAGNGLGLFAISRSMLELSAFLHEVAGRLRSASELSGQSWRQAGESYFAVITRARFATTNASLAELLRTEGVAKKRLEPFNVMSCIRGLAEEPGREHAEQRYSDLCDFVHHNLGSLTASNVGSGVGDVMTVIGGRSAAARGATYTRYEYPLPGKARLAEEQTATGFIHDATDSMRWMKEAPTGPYTEAHVLEMTGSLHGMGRFPPAPQRVPRRQVGRNEPCPCGSERKFKHCCGRAAPPPS